MSYYTLNICSRAIWTYETIKVVDSWHTLFAFRATICAPPVDAWIITVGTPLLTVLHISSNVQEITKNTPGLHNYVKFPVLSNETLLLLLCRIKWMFVLAVICNDPQLILAALIVLKMEWQTWKCNNWKIRVWKLILVVSNIRPQLHLPELRTMTLHTGFI